MTFIYVDNRQSYITLDNEVKLTIWFDEYCEAYMVSFNDSDIDATNDVCASIFLFNGNKLILLKDMLKAAEGHMYSCRKEDEIDASDYHSHIQSLSSSI